MTSNSILNKTFGLSLLLHGTLLALLVLVGTRGPVYSDSPLRVRILESSAPSSAPAPVPAPQVAPRVPTPPPGRFSSEPLARGERATTEGKSREPRAGSQEGGSRPSGTSEETRLVQPSSPPPPQVAARPTPEPTVPSTQRLAEPPPDLPPVRAPERRGLTLGGPPPGTSVVPQGKAVSPSGGIRPSLRDQIASLGSGLSGDADEPAKRTIHLDSRDPVYLPYLARLKQRIQREWVYPEEAWSRGVSGDLLLVFTLNKNGSLTNLRLVQSSGFPILDQEALRAIKQSAPFDPFPPQMGEEPWNISAAFHYNLPYRFRRN